AYVLLSVFFQAEDGIRDRNVTGVQTCALPIYRFAQTWEADKGCTAFVGFPSLRESIASFSICEYKSNPTESIKPCCSFPSKLPRSEERRVGRECSAQ